jgi:hypothetical protein
MSDFYKYFKENMAGLGLPAPESLFGTLQAAVGSASVLLGMVDKFGKRVTVGELIGAGTRLEGLAVISACAAAFYVGAVIGSIAVATGRNMADGGSISDVLATVNKYHFSRPWLSDVLRRWPGIYKPSFASRDTYHRCAALA